MAPIQGFLAILTVDTNDLTEITVTTPLARTKSSLNKATQDGTGSMVSIPGVESGSLSVSGFLDDALHNAMETTWAKTDPVPFTLIVAGSDTTDAQWAGNLVLTSFTVNPVEDGVWEFDLDGDTSGPVVYTPSAP